MNRYETAALFLSSRPTPEVREALRESIRQVNVAAIEQNRPEARAARALAEADRLRHLHLANLDDEDQDWVASLLESAERLERQAAELLALVA